MEVFSRTFPRKSPCDGISGTIEHEATRKSLQATSPGHILTPLDLYQWAPSAIRGTKTIFAPTDDFHILALSKNNYVDVCHNNTASLFTSPAAMSGRVTACYLDGSDYFQRRSEDLLCSCFHVTP